MDEKAEQELRYFRADYAADETYLALSLLSRISSGLAENFENYSPAIAVAVKNNLPFAVGIGNNGDEAAKKLARLPDALSGSTVATNFDVSLISAAFLRKFRKGEEVMMPSAICALSLEPAASHFLNSGMPNKFQLKDRGSRTVPNYPSELYLPSSALRYRGRSLTEWQKEDAIAANAVCLSAPGFGLAIMKRGALLGSAWMFSDKWASVVAATVAGANKHCCKGSVAASSSHFSTNEALQFLADAGIRTLLTFFDPGADDRAAVSEICDKHKIKLVWRHQ